MATDDLEDELELHSNAVKAEIARSSKDNAEGRTRPARMLMNEMTSAPRFSVRFWSLIAAVSLPIIELFAESLAHGLGGYYEIERAALAAACLALLIHSWIMQRRFPRAGGGSPSGHCSLLS